MTDTIIYIDEQDRSYGLSGMAVSLALLNNEEKIMAIDLDRTEEPIDFSHDFYFSGNPRCSAKAVWDEMTRNFQLAMAMTVGNLLSRRMVGQNARPTADEEEALHELMLAEGAEICCLEADEVEMVWRKELSYLTRVFAHPAVQRLTGQLADMIVAKRSLTRHEIMEMLSGLNNF